VFTPVIRFGELEIDLLHRRARVDARELHLTPLELSLLYLLAANAGRVLTRDEILDHVWGPSTWPRATSSTATSATFGRSCGTAGANLGTSPPSPPRATGSCPR
jgi:hypothetical protein